MIRSRQPSRGTFLSRTALGIALSLGVAAGGIALPTAAHAAKEKAPKIEFSKEFAQAAAELDKTVSTASENPEITAASDRVKAAKTPEEKSAAEAQLDAALGGGKSKLAAAVAAASTPGDRLKAGELSRNLGVFFNDPALQHRGLVMMIDSGVLPAEQIGQVQYLAGITAYQSRDFASAVKYLKPAYDSGYRDSQGLLQTVLADAYKRTDNPAAALEMAKADLNAAEQAGTKPGETSIRTALQAAYDARNKQEATKLASKLVTYYPDKDSWSAALTVVRALASYEAQENLDLMRLMARTGALDERTDFVEYVENADPRRLPGEVIRVIDAGVSAGKLQASDSYITNARSQASGRVSADKASLPSLESDARAARATASVATGAGDAFLSYDQPAKAEEFYKIALEKPGVETGRVLTRLGISQADQGKYAEAQQTLAKVTGPRAAIAEMWSAYAAIKAGANQTASAQ